ncbi:hypothetical protein C2869_10860 [Saccharobesus litoralis]|uniref:EAL domain-containing protein n=1 Tax=Saccharobesus litoralis TaxID=2172099 RepID=A0A2S0VRT7_9ALTE|nr:EAL domain-containing protein [Saccharobesus litoralis]AWB66903.1 hypothetical protein C2869_10860 [Saccharobesus litoralis]
MNQNPRLAQNQSRSIVKQQGSFSGWFDKWQVNSHFQPIYSIALQRVVGYEGLMRVNDNGRAISPLVAFASCNSIDETLKLDRLSRALHLLNFKSVQSRGQWIFLNLRGEEICQRNLDPSDLVEQLARHGYQPRQIVLEILEDLILDDQLLIEFVANYKAAGFIVAIDDFGAGYSNFDRIWKLNPNIVKLDRCMIASAVEENRARRIFSRLISLVRETESLVLIEGIETQDEALLAMDSEADMVQGYYFAKPNSMDEVRDCDALMSFKRLGNKLNHQKASQDLQYQSKVKVYESLLSHCANMLQLGVGFKESCQHLIKKQGCSCVYMLNQEGFQVTTTLKGIAAEATDTHYQPFADNEGINWARREYFSKAISAMGKVYISQPYLALPDVAMNVTISLAFSAKGQSYVLCCDVDYKYLEVADEQSTLPTDLGVDLDLGNMLLG